MDSKTKKILLIAGAAILGLYLINRQRMTEDKSGYANLVGTAGAAMERVNKTLNEGLDLIFNVKANNAVKIGNAEYGYIDDYHAKSPLYSKQNYF